MTDDPVTTETAIGRQRRPLIRDDPQRECLEVTLAMADKTQELAV